MTGWVPILLAAAAGVLGLVLVAGELVPAPPDLRAGLARLDGSSVLAAASADRPGWSLPALLRARAERATLRWPVLLRVPRQDLALLGLSTEQLIGRKIAFALGGLAFPGVLTGVSGMLLAPIPALVTVAAGVLGWFVPDLSVRDDAAKARAQFRRALCSYLELVALQRQAASGGSESLEQAAAIGHGWVFVRLRDTFTTARLAGVPQWRALGELGERVAVVELEHLGDTMRVTSEAGAAVAGTLKAKAASLRQQIKTEEATKAKAISARLGVGPAMFGLLFVVWITFPGAAAFMSGGG